MTTHYYWDTGGVNGRRYLLWENLNLAASIRFPQEAHPQNERRLLLAHIGDVDEQYSRDPAAFVRSFRTSWPGFTAFLFLSGGGGDWTQCSPFVDIVNDAVHAYGRPVLEDDVAFAQRLGRMVRAWECNECASAPNWKVLYSDWTIEAIDVLSSIRLLTGTGEWDLSEAKKVFDASEAQGALNADTRKTEIGELRTTAEKQRLGTALADVLLELRPSIERDTAYFRTQVDSAIELLHQLNRGIKA